MRTIKLISLFLLLAPFIYSQQQQPLGFGILKLDVGLKPVLNFFEDTANVQAVRTIAVVSAPSGDFVIKDEEQHKWFQPEQLFLNYDLMLLRVDTVIGEWMKVYINKFSTDTYWLRKNTEMQPKRWADFLRKDIFSVQRSEYVKLTVHTGPSATAPKIKEMEDADCFQALAIRGQWMQVKTNTELECSESRKPVKNGWIQWTSRNRLNIEYYLIY